MVEGLELMIQHGIYNVDVSFWKDLVQKGFGAYLAHIGQGNHFKLYFQDFLMWLFLMMMPVGMILILVNFLLMNI